MTLKRHPTQKLQKDSTLAIEFILNEMNCEFRTHTPDNAGIDGEIDLVKGGNFEGKLLKIQVKAGSSYISSENNDLLKLKVERKYVELWSVMNVPVILFFYHPDTKVIYWKSVQDYLRSEPKLLKKETESLLIPFDKIRDIFTTEVLSAFRKVADNDFKYEKIIFVDNEEEKVVSNWFSVISLPQKIYMAPSPYRDVKDINYQLKKYYSFILKSENLITFSDLTNPDCELRTYCDYSDDVLEIKDKSEIEENWYMELLNRMLFIFALQNQMRPRDEKFYFSHKVLDDEKTQRFPFKPLRREKETSRLKIYINKVGKVVEYKHMAVKLSFIKLTNEWYLQIEPDFHFSYPFDPTKTKRDAGIRLISEKATTYNEQYLYLLHAWRQFLSNSTPTITFKADSLPDSQTANISALSETFTSNFLLFNDYFGKEVHDESGEIT
jgi:hypothetical protein